MPSVSTAVVDAWAALAFLRKEGTAELTMRRYLRRAGTGNVRLVMSAVNLCEVHYRMIQLAGFERAKERLAAFRTLPIEVVPAREPLALDAASIKAELSLSLGDAFAVATARSERGVLLTGDPEILALPRATVRTVRLER